MRNIWNGKNSIWTKLKTPVIPECFYRESSEVIVFRLTGSPIETFGDDR